MDTLESLRDRVEALEKQGAADRYACHAVLVWEGMWPLGIEKVKPSRHVAAVVKRLEDAEAKASCMEQYRLDLEDVRTALAHERATVATLMDRVAELERETVDLGREVGRLGREKIEQRSRAEAAERRVLELEARVRDLHGDFIVNGPDVPATPTPAGMLEAVRRALTASANRPGYVISCEDREEMKRALAAFDAAK